MKQQLSQRQTLEQMRAQAAWQRVNQIKDESKERQDKDKGSLEKEYRSRVRSLNATIQINGLGSTLGFLKAKSESQNAPYLLLDHLTKWMIERKFIPTKSNLEDDDSDDVDDIEDADDTENSAHDIDGAKDATKRDPEMSFEGYDGILKWVISVASRDQYRQATTECLAFGLWLRRFAEAELESSSPQVSNADAQQATENESPTNTESGEGIAASSVEGIQQNG